MSFVVKPLNENEFTEFFFNGLLKEITDSSKDRFVSYIVGEDGLKVSDIQTQKTLSSGRRPDVYIECEGSEPVFFEVKVFPSAYDLGQIINHVKGISKEFNKAIYVFIDKNRVETNELTNEFQQAKDEFKNVKVRHIDWYSIYEFLEEELGNSPSESRDKYLIQKTLLRMREEPLNMKPFMGLDIRQLAFLKDVREDALRDISKELNENASLIIEEVEYKLYLRYNNEREIIKTEKPKGNVQIRVIPTITESKKECKPKIYVNWDWENNKTFEVFIGLFPMAQEDPDLQGFIFTRGLIYEVLALFKGLYMCIEINDNSEGYWASDDSDKPLEYWFDEQKEFIENKIKDSNRVWLGRYLKPEEYKGREIVDEIYKTLCLFLDKLIPFIENES